MAIQDDLIVNIKTSLADVRCAKVILDLEILMNVEFVKKIHTLLYTKSGTPIKTVSELIGHITKVESEFIPINVHTERHTNTLGGVVVKLNNIVYRPLTLSNDRGEIHLRYGSTPRYISFHLCYANDNDSALPMKVYALNVHKEYVHV